MVAMLVGTVGAMTAALIGRAFALTDLLGALPNGVASLIAGATGGLVVGVSSVGRHVAMLRAPLEHELLAMADESELGRLLGRAASAYRDAIQAIGGEAPAAREAADELVGKMTRYGKRWRELESEASRSAPEDLKERLQLIGRRLESSNDPLARAELARAREALAVQLAYVEEIANGRERAVARLEHQVATLERLRWAALRHRSADAARMGAELQPVIEELAEAGGDFDIASEALTEATIAGALPAVGRN
jgi:chromosome segregation ATPase